MKQEKTNRNCESCRTEIKVLDLCQEPNLILCELCKPWVLSSIYQVPRQVIGIDIEDPSLFRTSLRLTENLQSPSTESAWYKFLKFIFSKQSDSSDEESEMLTKIRLDYAGRNAIYSQEADDLYYGPEYDPSADWHALAKLSPYNGNHPFFDDSTVHFDFMLDLNKIIYRYVESLNTIEDEKQFLQENGWGSYVEQMTWEEIEPQIHNLCGTELSTSQFLECIDLVKSSRSVQYGLMAQVIFDFACDESKMSLESRINQTSKLMLSSSKTELSNRLYLAQSLVDRLKSGVPYAPQLIALGKEGLDPALLRFAKGGAPTLSDLTARLSVRAGELRDAYKTRGDTTWKDNLKSEISKLVTIKPTDSSKIKGMEGVLLRAEEAISKGNLEKAIDEIDSLEVSARGVLGAWLLEAKAKQNASIAAENLLAKTTAALRKRN